MKKPCACCTSPAAAAATSLDRLLPGEIAVVTALTNNDSMRRRLLDLGLTEGTQVCCVGKSPAGDPAAYRIRGAIIALRSEDSRAILVCRTKEEVCPCT